MSIVKFYINNEKDNNVLKMYWATSCIKTFNLHNTNYLYL
jgi:hypothetical protein